MSDLVQMLSNMWSSMLFKIYTNSTVKHAGRLPVVRRKSIYGQSCAEATMYRLMYLDPAQRLMSCSVASIFSQSLCLDDRLDQRLQPCLHSSNRPIALSVSVLYDMLKLMLDGQSVSAGDTIFMVSRRKQHALHEQR